MIVIPDRAAGLPRADPSVIERNVDRVFILSDTHWWHDNIVEYHHRPVDHTQLMIQRWWERVGKHDVVLHLGDVVHGIPTADLWASFPDRLPGRIYLVPGNHDRTARVEVFMAAGWQLLDPFSFVYRDTLVCFTHEPMPPEEVVDGVINVHGHIHSNPSPNARYLNVCVEMLDYAPTPLRALLDAKLDELAEGKRQR
ncbi:MAG: metallophosphoesterase [Candidatus Dormibacteraeota bacterium]|nr:metallophosphoesterase [Candidatus Dormibacteraeota bacterium]MBV9524446.1 metallophosphoesterase [Candidatus Dormibacteraeota bacterium]